MTAYRIPTPQGLELHRAAHCGMYPDQTAGYMHTTSSSREARHAVETILGHIYAKPQLLGYRYAGLNAKNAHRVEAAFKRAGWRCTRFAPDSNTPNHILVEWPVGISESPSLDCEVR